MAAFHYTAGTIGSLMQGVYGAHIIASLIWALSSMPTRAAQMVNYLSRFSL